MKAARFLVPLLVVAAAVALGLGVWFASSRLRLGLPWSASRQPLTLWGQYVAYRDGVLTLALSPAPGGSAAGETEAGQTIAILIPPGTPLTADYYIGDVLSGTLVKSEPLKLPRLQPGVLLRATVQPTGRDQWSATSVSWRQSVTDTKSPPMDIKTPPPISPP